ncbi:ferredoxin reductase [Amycolatopsis sp. lyj-109]|uniref:ferredoxin reductase n=1 Tax=Amycolatopsis sp. lyj-109 TaxID=2789287 RepID=UPI003978E487
MAGTALRRRLGHRRLTARLVAIRDETATARTLRFAVPGWPGHLAGQHADLRLTAEDGYTAQRSYSLSAPADGEFVELTVQLVPDGEVSPYLVRDIEVGDEVEVLGPLGGWFVWRPEQPGPVLLIGGGSGIAPLRAMLRARSAASPPFRLLYSVRTPSDGYFAGELDGPEVTVLYTREAPDGVERTPHRIDVADLTAYGLPAAEEPTCYVCGPTSFVETVTGLLIDAGHDPARVRAERFGG